MSRTLNNDNYGTSAVACADAWGPFPSKYRLEYVTITLSAAATTSENLTLTIDSARGAAYDHVIWSEDLSAGSPTSITYKPVGGIDIMAGDVVDLAYANTDTNTVSWIAFIDPAPGD